MEGSCFLEWVLQGSSKLAGPRWVLKEGILTPYLDDAKIKEKRNKEGMNTNSRVMVWTNLF